MKKKTIQIDWNTIEWAKHCVIKYFSSKEASKLVSHQAPVEVLNTHEAPQIWMLIAIQTDVAQLTKVSLKPFKLLVYLNIENENDFVIT